MSNNFHEGTPNGADNFSNASQRERFVDGMSTDLKSPYAIAFMERAQEKIPENAAGMHIILSELDRQAVTNFGLFTPREFPGTEISFIKLSIAPDLVRKISAVGNTLPDTPPVPNEETDEGEARNKLAFLFTAMGKPPEGNAYAAEDVGIDRFIRCIPKVARAMKEGLPIPNADVYLLGSGTGYGEKASAEFVDEIKKRGLEVRGEVYAEFIQQVLNKKELDNTEILIQGVSMGTTTADRTFALLPDEVKRITQRLFDNPAGTHTPSLVNYWRGLQAAIGVVAEFVQKESFNAVSKTLRRTKGSFIEYLSEQKGLQPDTPEEKKMKDNLFKAAGFKLFTGTPLDLGSQEDTDEIRDKVRRPYVRRGLWDPLTTTPARILKIAMRRGGIIIETKGRALEAPFKGSHFFIYENFDRFNQIINYCKTIPSKQTA